ncbi:hypothetical protein BZL30_1846 [Mycobacterium kansasii]|uniref:Uncharacterized protein n=1 Tax=Mycobacterium kansasii TaxID=1768 RepID=A0A1V3XI37_MYCKA|nr:hypothetical protein BZL30_1846 [Mycobacterium kansasii]
MPRSVWSAERAGKSSVLRIMAGLDKPNNGDAFLATGASVGILQQEPPLNDEKTVRATLKRAWETSR